MLQKIENWLKNPKRDYASGLEFFNQLADVDIKAKFGGFLNGVKDVSDSKETVVHFPQLIHRVNLIYGKIKANPDAYKDLLVVETESTGDSVKKIVELQKTVESLQDKMDDLESDSGNNSDEIESLGDELKQSKSEIESLKKKLEDSGVKVITSDELPEEIKALYTRNKEITPLMASLHADLKSETITDEERKKLAEELCTLDDERRSNWDTIDEYLEDGNLSLPEDRSLVYSDDPLIKGAQIAKRIDRLKENIKRAEDAAVKHAEAGKQNLVAKAQARVATYTAELNELQGQLDETT